MIFSVFEEFVKEHSEDDTEEDIIEKLADLRSEFAIRYAVEGFDMEWDEALELLRTTEGLTPQQRAKRDILVAAVDNIIEFSVAEEYQCLDEMYEEFEGEETWEEVAYAIFKKYNLTYAEVEDMDIKFAMTMAAAIAGVPDEGWLMYETQRDDRVRPWHAVYDGFMAPKYAFPEWLVPPIEWGCRCFLESVTPTDKIHDVQAKVVKVPTMPEWFNRTFEESVAFGGRIFSDKHPYFSIDAENRPALDYIAERIKAKYFNAII